MTCDATLPFLGTCEQIGPHRAHAVTCDDPPMRVVWAPDLSPYIVCWDLDGLRAPVLPVPLDDPFA